MKSFLLCLLCLLWTGHVVADNKAAAIPMVSDLARDGAQAEREGKPVILFFSLPGCPFCHVVRNNYLYPLLRDSKRRERPIIREVDMASAQSVQNFDRGSATPRSIAMKYKVIAAPTVIFVDARGCMLAPPIIGGDIAGVYGGYLDNAFDASAQKIAAAKRAGRAMRGGEQECAPP